MWPLVTSTLLGVFLVLSDDLAVNEVFRYFPGVEGIYATEKAVWASSGLCTTNGKF